MACGEEHDIVIVGGGICGLATALALHRKGINSLVLEKSATLRAAGAAIGIYLNGWHALDQLGVGADLRAKAVPISEIREVWLHKNSIQVTPCGKEAFRCLKRSDLIECLANNLPAESIRFGCQIVALEADSETSFPILHTDDGRVIKAKVLIGCDGSNSLVAKSLGLEPPKLFAHLSVRAFTSYPEGHNLGSNFLQVFDDGIFFGRIPINDKLVHWFVGHRCSPKVTNSLNYASESGLEKHPKLIRELTLKLLKKFPLEAIEMVRQCDIDSLSLYQVRYRSPWNLLLANFYRDTTTVAGDALHVIGPFLGQGGSASLEDAIVLARCLASVISNCEVSDDHKLRKSVGIALEKYSRQRRLRVLRLSLQSYLVGLIMLNRQGIKKLLIVAILIALFGSPRSLSYAVFDCGHL